MREGLANPAVSMLVADDDGALAGFVGCGSSRDPDASPGVGEVRSLLVAAGRWRGGVGRVLMDAALADLGVRGYSFATVWSFADNERANRFYEESGFERDGGERREPVWADILELRYRRALP